MNCVDVSKSGSAIVSGDDFGFVKLFPFPCKEKGVCKPISLNVRLSYFRLDIFQAKGGKYVGHSEHVTNVKFSFDDSRVVSIGGADCSFVQSLQPFSCRILDRSTFSACSSGRLRNQHAS